MNYFLQPIYFFVIILFLYLFTVLLNSFLKKDSQIALAKGFVLSSAILIISFFYLCFIGFSVNQFVIEYVLALLILFVIQIIRKKIKWIIFSRQDIPMLLIGIVGSLLYIIPVVITKRSDFYSDQWTYVSCADYWRENAYRVMANYDAFSGWLYGPALYYKEGLRMGSQLFLAFWSSFFRVELSLELFVPCVAVAMFLFSMAIWNYVIGFTKEKNNKVTIIILLFGTFNTTVISWSASQALMPQLYGFGLLLTAMSVFINERKIGKSILQHVMTCILISGLILSYDELFPFMVLSLFVYVMVLWFKNKGLRLILIRSCCIDVILTLLICSIYVPSLIKSLIYQINAVVGYEIDHTIAEYIGYLFSTVYVTYYYKTGQNIFVAMFFGCLTVLTVLLTLIGVAKLIKRAEKEIVLEYICIIVPYILLGIYYQFIAADPFNDGQIGNSWSIYKLVQYFTAISIPYLGYFIVHGGNFKKRFMRRALYIVGCIWLGMNLFFAVRFENYISSAAGTLTGNEENPTAEYYAIREKYKDYDGTIWLNNVSATHQMVLTYFLKEHKIYSVWSSEAAEYDGSGIILTTSYANDATANLSETNAWIDWGSEVYDEESSDDGSSWRWSSGSTVCLMKPQTEGNYTIDFSLLSISDTGTATITINNEDTYTYSINSLTPTEVSIPITYDGSDKIEMDIDYDGPVSSNNNGDTRTLAYRIIDMTIN